MGNCLECVPICKSAAQKTSADDGQMSFTSTYSITNASSSRTESGSPTISSISAKSINDALSWTQLQAMYAESVQEDTDQIILDSTVLTAMEGIFWVVRHSMKPMSRQFYRCLVEADKNFPAYFEDCAGNNYRSITEDKPLMARIQNHIVVMMDVYNRIIVLLKDGKTEQVYSLLKLLAISHALMKVSSKYVKFMDLVMGKFLVMNKLLYEENAEAVVLFFGSVTNYICRNINLQKTHDATLEQSTARENYREMKNWYNFIQELHEDMDRFDGLETENEVPEEASKESDNDKSGNTRTPDILQQEALLLKYFLKKKKVDGKTSMA